LPNRLLLHERLEHAVLRARRSHTNTAILFADLDQFKLVNDAYGHQVGDELLLAVAQRLSAYVRSGDTLARFSGDEFVFLCEDLQSAADVELLAERICEAFATPFELSSVQLTVAASVGIAFAGPAEAISGQLLAKADMAMYEVKRKGGAGRAIVDLRDAMLHHEDDSLELDLRKAIDDDQLDVVYQPIVRTADGTVVGVEALLRWNHPDRGPIAPQAIVAIAEQSELIDDLGAWVLDRSCRDRSEWMRESPGTPQYLVVNVSARQLLSPSLYSSVIKALAAAHMEPADLILELTETLFIEDSNRTMRVLRDLETLGCRLALGEYSQGVYYTAPLPASAIGALVGSRVGSRLGDPAIRAVSLAS
jgi:diguanylate cyclase (GGDEF)-like protein